ncbi:hypothetical protein DV515_00000082 [Chloebia gouldiae]|uniref:Uncharacterized protein n=1 Tax=Chloebia gouldiae TaxID=44316 RepID=A0A3L8T2G5_CHLGU|nr:hypothetical protein DV515_00000082 [Chloebia gouldiae]
MDSVFGFPVWLSHLHPKCVGLGSKNTIKKQPTQTVSSFPVSTMFLIKLMDNVEENFWKKNQQLREIQLGTYQEGTVMSQLTNDEDVSHTLGFLLVPVVSLLISGSSMIEEHTASVYTNAVMTQKDHIDFICTEVPEDSYIKIILFPLAPGKLGGRLRASGKDERLHFAWLVVILQLSAMSAILHEQQLSMRLKSNNMNLFNFCSQHD